MLEQRVDGEESSGDPQRIESDLECVGCGYNLRTQACDGICTECGLPVGRSALPIGFRLPSRRAALAIRRGLAILVAAILLETVLWIQIDVVLRYALQLSNRQWINRSVKAWVYGTSGSKLIELIAILVITRLLAKKMNRFRPRLAGVIVVIALLGLLTEGLILQGWSYASPSILSNDWVFGLKVVVNFLRICEPLSIVLLWVFMLSTVDSDKSRMLRLIMLFTFVPLALILCGEIIDAFYWTSDIVFARNNGSLYMGSLMTSPPKWTYDIIDLYNWWNQNISAACKILIVLAVWFYRRTLDSSLKRSTKCGLIGNMSHGPNAVIGQAR